jgi:hypothetical protein
MIKYIIIILFFTGLLFVITDIIKINNNLCNQEPQIIYRYIPRTFNEEQNDPIYATDIFEKLFSNPSPWTESVRSLDIKKQEAINKYFLSQI